MASGLTMAAFYALTRPSWEATTVCFLSGILIDVDHVVDLCIYKKRIVLSAQALFNFCEREKGGKLYLVLHSYELLALLWISIGLFKLSDVWLGLALGLSVHMALDQFSNPVRPWVYFFWYRIKYGFAKEHIFKADYYRKMDL